MRLKKGFTLAEILIVLMVIGVIATLTIPSLNNNVNKNTYATALKTTSMSLTDKFRSQMAIEDVGMIGELRAFVNTSTVAAADARAALLKELSEFMLFSPADHDHEVYCLDGTSPSAGDYTNNPWKKENMRKLPNGSLLTIYLYHQNGAAKTGEMAPLVLRSKGGELLIRYAVFCIDINGYKKPNRFGRDIFKFYLGQDGVLYPVGGYDATLYELGKTEPSYSMTDQPKYNCLDEESKGFGCAGRIEDEDWKMLY